MRRRSRFKNLQIFEPSNDVSFRITILAWACACLVTGRPTKTCPLPVLKPQWRQILKAGFGPILARVAAHNLRRQWQSTLQVGGVSGQNSSVKMGSRNRFITIFWKWIRRNYCNYRKLCLLFYRFGELFGKKVFRSRNSSAYSNMDTLSELVVV